MAHLIGHMSEAHGTRLPADLPEAEEERRHLEAHGGNLHRMAGQRPHHHSSLAHPGFKRVQDRIAVRLQRQNPGMSHEEANQRAGAILAASSRRASAGAKAANPRLRRV